MGGGRSFSNFGPWIKMMLYRWVRKADEWSWKAVADLPSKNSAS